MKNHGKYVLLLFFGRRFSVPVGPPVSHLGSLGVPLRVRSRKKKVENQPVLFLAEGVFMYLDGEKVKDLILKLQSRFPNAELVCEVVTEIFTRKPWNKIVALKMNKELGVGKGAAFIFGIRNSHELETWHSDIEFLDEWSYFESEHPRLGWVGILGKLNFMQKVQYTVHYRLN